MTEEFNQDLELEQQINLLFLDGGLWISGVQASVGKILYQSLPSPAVSLLCCQHHHLLI